MKFSYPIKTTENEEEAAIQAERLYGHKNRLGFYPVGLQNAWHGGIHIEGSHPITCIADGRVIAYRMPTNYLKQTVNDKKIEYSNGFILIQHNYKSPNKGQELTFYSLYQHLMPKTQMEEKREKKGEIKVPDFYAKYSAKVTSSDVEYGLGARSGTEIDKKDTKGRGKNKMLIPYGHTVIKIKVEELITYDTYTPSIYKVPTNQTVNKVPASQTAQRKEHWSDKKENSKYIKITYQDNKGVTHKDLYIHKSFLKDIGNDKYTVNYKKDKITSYNPKAPKGAVVYNKVNGKIIKVIPKDKEFEIEKVSKGWCKIKGKAEYIEEKSLKITSKLKDDVALDVVENCDFPIAAGTVIGHTGQYSSSQNPYYDTAHVEVFTADKAQLDSFLINEKGEVDKQYYKTKANTTLKLGTVHTIPKDTKVKVYKRSGKYAQIGFENQTVIVSNNEIDFKTYSSKNGYTIIKDFDSLNSICKNALEESGVNKSTYKYKKHMKPTSTGGHEIITESAEKLAVAKAKKEEKPYVKYRKIEIKHPQTIKKTKYWIQSNHIGGTDLGEGVTSDQEDEWVTVTEAIAIIYKKEPKGEIEEVLEKPIEIHSSKLESYTDADNQVWKKVKGFYRDEKSDRVTKKGFVKSEDLEIINPYNWTEFEFKTIDAGGDYLYPFDEETPPPPFIEEVWALVDIDGDKELSLPELHQATRDKAVMHRLSHMICKHPNEWANSGDNFQHLKTEFENAYAKGINKEENTAKKQELETAKNERLQQLEEKIKNLCFWNQIKNGDLVPVTKRRQAYIEKKHKPVRASTLPKGTSPKEIALGKEFDELEKERVKRVFPKVANVWHFHPIAFVEQMKIMVGQQNWRNPIDNPMLCLFSQNGGAKPWHGSFGKKIRDNTRNHTGADLLAIPGTNVYASIKSKIIRIYTSTSMAGNTIITKVLDVETFKSLKKNYNPLYSQKGELTDVNFNHNGPFYLVFFHLQKMDFYNEGDIVEANDIIGLTGVSGKKGKLFDTCNPHLHFEINNKPGRGLEGKCNPSMYFDFKSKKDLTQEEINFQEKLKRKEWN